MSTPTPRDRLVSAKEELETAVEIVCTAIEILDAAGSPDYGQTSTDVGTKETNAQNYIFQASMGY